MSLQAAQAKLLAVDPSRWPAPVAALALAQPLLTLAVRAAGPGFELVSNVGVPSESPCDIFCKLGIKSWRDSGSLRAIRQGLRLPEALDALLATPTPQQRVLARAWTDNGTPLLLRLLPYIDFCDISEVRWLTGPREVRFISACQRGASAPLLGPALARMKALAQAFTVSLPPLMYIIELACLPDGSLKLVEINPGLQPAEIRALHAA